MQSRVLLADDDQTVRIQLENELRKEGYDVLIAVTGLQAIESTLRESVDLIILDFHLPDLHGVEICRRIRRHPITRSVPILATSNQDSPGLATMCLKSGADAYLAKPFEITELLAHVQAILRRPKMYLSDPTVIHQGRLVIRVSERRILFNGRSVADLTPKEFDLVKNLVQRAPLVVEKDLLAREVWGIPFDQMNRRTLDVHIRRIRQKLGPAAAGLLKTVTSIGYQWTESNVDPPSDSLQSSLS